MQSTVIRRTIRIVTAGAVAAAASAALLLAPVSQDAGNSLRMKSVKSASLYGNSL